MRAFLAWVIVLALLAVAVDAGLERVAERRASQQASVLLDAPATVDLRGWPVSLRLLLGTLPAVDVHATNVPTDARVRVARLEARLSEVRLRLADLSTGRLPASARSGTFVADLDPAAVERLLGPVGRVSDIRLVAGAVQLRIVGIAVDAAVAVEDGTLVVTLVNVPRDAPREVPRRLKVPLPTLPAGATIERVIVLDGVLQLEGTFIPALLERVPRVRAATRDAAPRAAVRLFFAAARGRVRHPLARSDLRSASVTRTGAGVSAAACPPRRAGCSFPSDAKESGSRAAA